MSSTNANDACPVRILRVDQDQHCHSKIPNHLHCSAACNGCDYIATGTVQTARTNLIVHQKECTFVRFEPFVKFTRQIGVALVTLSKEVTRQGREIVELRKEIQLLKSNEGVFDVMQTMRDVVVEPNNKLESVSDAQIASSYDNSIF